MAKKTYTVEIVRESYSTLTFKVEAANIKEAEEIALDNAGSYEFREHDANYKAVCTTLADDNTPFDYDLAEK